MQRRAFLANAAALAMAPTFAFGSEVKLSLVGKMEAGSLVIGHVPAGTQVKLDGVQLLVSANGVFAFGFEYDQKTSAHLEVLYPDQSIDARDILPTPRNYEVQRIDNLPPQIAHPTDPEITARIGREHALVNAARKIDSDMDYFSEGFDWPAKGIISGLFGSQRILNGSPSAPHMGVDIAGGEGTAIHAPANATVLLAEQFFLEGGYTLLDHGHGVFTGYMHQSAQLVHAGDGIERGQQIGNIGHTGRATGPHLHWQMNWFQVRLDPSLSTLTPAPPRV